MTPDKLDYLPCKTCGVLENRERPHDPAWCKKAGTAHVLTPDEIELIVASIADASVHCLGPIGPVGEHLLRRLKETEQ